MWNDWRFDRGEWCSEKILRLFNSELGPRPRGEPESYAQFLDALRYGKVSPEYVLVTCRAAPKPPLREEQPSDAWKLFRLCRRGGADLHGWLKWWAYQWLLESTGQPPDLEVIRK